MKRAVGYFIKYPVLADTVLVLFFIFGFFGLKNMRSSFFPEVESRTIQVQVIYPGASPQEVEEGVVLRIENEIRGVTGVERISSVSQENSGVVTVEVIKGYDTDDVLIDVQNAVDRIPTLPEGMEPVRTFTVENVRPAVSFALSGEDVDLRALKAIARRVEDDLRAIEGISKVELQGLPEEEIEIAFREEDLRAQGITFAQAALRVRAANIDITGGKVRTEAEELSIRARNKHDRAHELRDIVLKATPDGRFVRLGDVADLRDRWADDPTRNYLNGAPAVVVAVSSTVSEDILFIAEESVAYMERFNERGEAVHADLISDATIALRQRIDMLATNGVQGFLLVVLFLAMFLNIRLAFWVALSIPVAFAGMFVLANFFGITINVMSLFGMIIVVGILVDDGIVIAESIYQEHEKGASPVRAAVDGTMNVLPAVISAVFTTVAAFSTFFFLDGRLGDFAPALAFVVISTLIISLIEGAFILPAHIAHSKALKEREKNAFEQRLDRLMQRMRHGFYEPFLERALRSPILAFGIFFFLLNLTFGALGAGWIQTTFFPVVERDDINVELEMVAGTREHIVNAELARIEDVIWRVNEELKAQREDSLDVVLKVQRKLGPRPEQGSLFVVLLDGETRDLKTDKLSALVRERTGEIPGAEKATFGIASPFGKPVSVSLRGHDLEDLDHAKDELIGELQQLSFLRDVVTSDRPGEREVVLRLKEKAFALGLTHQDVLAQVRQGFFGAEAQRVQRGQDEIKIWVRYDEEGRSSLRDLEDMRIRTADGNAYPLRELADHRIERRVKAINHLDGRREVRVEADMASFDKSVTDAQAAVADELLPPILQRYPSVTYSFEGQGEQSKKVGRSVQKILPITLILMLAMIVITLRSFWQMIAIVACIPFGFIGMGWGHFIHGVQISLLSGFGAIALIGVMVNDSLVLVSAFNGLVKQGMPFRQAVHEAAVSRFRPILLTSVTTIAGLAPIVLNKSFQAQFLVPMAITIAYGLFVATFITLFLLPVYLVWVNGLKRGVYWLWNARLPEAREVEPAYKEIEFEEMDH